MNLLYIISPVTSFLLAFMLIPVSRKLALHVGLVDRPNHRKVHSSPVPLVGGISIFVATTLALSMTFPSGYHILAFKNTFIATTILLIMGMLDDRFDLKASLKLAIQLLLAHFIYQQGISIESLHSLFGLYELEPWIQHVLTIVVIAGVVNAFNLMDGIDGLAAGLAIAGFAVFTWLAFLTSQYELAIIFLTNMGGLLAFLRFNLSKKQKVFMGDAGSLVFGFVLVVSGISLVQNVHNAEHIPMVAIGVLSVLLLPVFDALRVFRKRLKSGKSPFSADKTHLHHLMLSTGLKHKTAALTIVTFMTCIILLGYLSYQIAGLTMAIVAMFVFFYTITAVLQFNDKIKLWKNSIRKMEGSI